MTVSVDELEKRFERKRKYAEMFKEKQAKQAAQPVPVKKPFEPTVICHFFVEGRCQKGDKCTFLHKTEKKFELCKFYQGGFCSKGDKCTYMHGEFPCKFYHHLKKCLHGDKCRFSHEPIQDPVLIDAFEKYLRADEEFKINGSNGIGAGGGAGKSLGGMNAVAAAMPIQQQQQQLSPTHKPEVMSSLPSLMNLAVKPAEQVKNEVSFYDCFYF